MPPTLPITRIGLIMLIAAVFPVLHSGCAGDNKVSAGSDSNSDTSGDSDSDTGPLCDPASVSLLRAETSAVIGTVGIVEWSTVMTPVVSASIEFGLDTRYGYTAPVDLTSPSYRTLLLGMKPSEIYHFRIVVNGCNGADHTIETGAPPTDLPKKSVSIQDSAASTGGFIVTSTGMKSHYAYILDKDGDYVWWYAFEPAVDSSRMDGISRAKMSADGTYMWSGTINVGCGCGYLFGIGMDGLGTQATIAVDRHHDFTVLPDNTVVYIEYTDNGDRIVERSESGTLRIVYNLNDDFSGEGIDWSHCNAIHYYPSDDSYTVSCLGLNNIIKIDRTSGSLIWRLEGDAGGDFSGITWNGQHGHQLLENGNILIFSNGGANRDTTNDSGGAFGGVFNLSGAEVLELALSSSAGTADEIWRYQGQTYSAALGDVQRLPSGNTLVTYSIAGDLTEVSPSKEIVRTITVDGLGYADWRPTLYGAPYRY